MDALPLAFLTALPPFARTQGIRGRSPRLRGRVQAILIVAKFALELFLSLTQHLKGAVADSPCFIPQRGAVLGVSAECKLAIE